ncbi:hypothetical protein JAAARDRAFT_50415 [Jaapia argillacea MUCL 33604]|uniref:Uncharacterized protein n=1 Tax=Jaapia argillacea MUCL 33604 TaxID=933084 RepID=A0A067PBK8_9AGAM|nr:hypothetical protein JAAARDRAFT_50415 [Jaapia argillacea MUCL 33604]
MRWSPRAVRQAPQRGGNEVLVVPNRKLEKQRQCSLCRMTVSLQRIDGKQGRRMESLSEGRGAEVALHDYTPSDAKPTSNRNHEQSTAWTSHPPYVMEHPPSVFNVLAVFGLEMHEVDSLGQGGSPLLPFANFVLTSVLTTSGCVRAIWLEWESPPVMVFNACSVVTLQGFDHPEDVEPHHEPGSVGVATRWWLYRNQMFEKPRQGWVKPSETKVREVLSIELFVKRGVVIGIIMRNTSGTEERLMGCVGNKVEGTDSYRNRQVSNGKVPQEGRVD